MACVDQNYGNGKLWGKNSHKIATQYGHDPAFVYIVLNFSVNIYNHQEVLMTMDELTEPYKCLGGELRTWKDSVVQEPRDANV